MISDGNTQFIVRVISSQAYVDTLTNAIQSKLSDLIMVKQWTIDWVTQNNYPYRMDNINAKKYDGYKFVCWINFTSNGNIAPLYTDTSTEKDNVTVFTLESERMKGNKLDCIAMYIKV